VRQHCEELVLAAISVFECRQKSGVIARNAGPGGYILRGGQVCDGVMPAARRRDESDDRNSLAA
jgi:hypothetical protein